MRNFLIAKYRFIEWLVSAWLNSKFKTSEEQLHIITGADNTHANSLINLLESIKKFEPFARVTVWNLGLSSGHLDHINSMFPDFKVNYFDFKKYPDYVNIKVNGGAYAWKPIMISNSILDIGGIALYLDAGNLVTGRLTHIKRFTMKKGLFSPYSPGTIRDWTHPKTLEKMQLQKKLQDKRNCNGAIISIDLSNRKALNVIKSWTDFANDESCISPPGSNKLNHRWDQAILSVLCEMNGFNTPGKYRNLARPLNILTHQDVE